MNAYESKVRKKIIDLLLVDDDEELREDMARYFSQAGYLVSEAESGERALELADQRAFQVIVLDMVMPGISGLELLQKLSERGADAEIIMLTGQGSIPSAVEAMKLGAVEFISKPIALPVLESLIEKCVHARAIRNENQQLRKIVKQQIAPSRIIGKSNAMREVFRLIERTAGSTDPVLITGESGTGKELVARALHEASPLSDKPLVVINCAALTETLLESELFGHEKGAFTGAVSTKVGLFEVADGGTLFIDEFGELAASLQAKLLRVLEDGTLRRVGSVKERRVNVRIIAATNRNLEKEVEAGNFRQDLYYRINVLTIHIPPLRERTGDIELLVEHFLRDDEWECPMDVMTLLTSYGWPGNVRQLENALQRAKVLAEGDTIELRNLPPEIVRQANKVEAPAPGTKCDLDTFTKLHIAESYARQQGNKARTARALGIGRRTLYRLLEKYEIAPPRNVSDN